MDQDEAVAVVIAYQATWPHPELPNSTRDAWAGMLEAHDREATMAALRQLAQSWTNAYPPPIGALLQAITEQATGPVPLPAEAWGQLRASNAPDVPVETPEGRRYEIRPQPHPLVLWAGETSGAGAALRNPDGTPLAAIRDLFLGVYGPALEQVRRTGRLPAGCEPYREPERRRLNDEPRTERPALEAGDDADDVEGVPPPPEFYALRDKLAGGMDDRSRLLTEGDEQPQDGA